MPQGAAHWGDFYNALLGDDMATMPHSVRIIGIFVVDYSTVNRQVKHTNFPTVQKDSFPKQFSKVTRRPKGGCRYILVFVTTWSDGVR